MHLFGCKDRIHLSRSQCFSIVADIHIPLIFCHISLALLLLEQGMCVSTVRYNQLAIKIYLQGRLAAVSLNSDS